MAVRAHSVVATVAVLAVLLVWLGVAAGPSSANPGAAGPSSADRGAESPVAERGIICSVCRFFVSVVRDHVAHPQHPGEQRLEQVVIHGCRWFPDSYKPACHDFVEQYGRDVIDWLSHGEHRIGDLCFHIHACASRSAAGRCGPRATAPRPPQ